MNKPPVWWEDPIFIGTVIGIIAVIVIAHYS
jgi:hypothetical protein